MKKRLLSMLMAVLMIASLVPATALAASTTCNHENKTEIVVEKNATEKQPGITAYVCDDCGKVFDKTGKEVTNVVTPFVPKRDYCKVCTNPVVVTYKATCENGGLTVTYCGTCGQQMALKATAKTGHIFSVDSFSVVVAPACAKTGWGYAVCDVCGTAVYADAANAASLVTKGEMKTEAYEKAKKEVVDLYAALEHVDADKAVAVTETTYNKDGSVKYQAEVAAAHVATVGLKEGELKGTGFTTANNCYVDENGVIVDKTREDIDVTMLTGKGWEATKLCPNCEDHVVVAAKAVSSHNYLHWNSMTVLVTGKEPVIDPEDGAMFDGVTDKIFCAECGKTYGGDVISAATYFAPETAKPTIGDTKIATKNGEEGTAAKAATPATCCEKGYTGDTLTYIQNGVDKDGNAVGKWIVTALGKDLDMIKHNYKTLESEAATCTENGVKYVGIKVCMNVVDKNEDGTPVYCYEKNTAVDGGFELAKLNNATVVNGEVTEYGEVLEKAHGTPVEKVLVEATCQHTGLNALACSVCDEYVADENDDNAYVTKKVDCVAAEELANVVEATCTEKGYTGDKVCKWCGTVLEKGEETELAEHNYVNGVCTVCEAVDPDYVENPFTDVSKDSVFYDAIIWAVQNKVTNGTTATTFSPSKGCTRAEIVAFLYNAAGCPEIGADVVNPFTDVSKDSNFYNAIMWAVEKGITKGTTDTTFSPSKVCTRGEIVTFLFRASGDEKVSTGVAFTDVAEGSYCYDAVAWAVANKVAFGKTGTTFAPADTCTRAEAVTFIYRANAE